MKKEYKRIKQNSIILSLLFVGFASLVGLITMRVFEESIIKSYQESTLKISNHLATLVTDQLSLKLKELEFLADVIVEKIGDEESFDFDILNQDLKSEIFNNLYLAKSDGTVHSSDGKEINYKDKDFFQIAMNGTRYISNPSISGFDGQKVIIYAVPVEKNGSVIGVLCGRNTVQELTEFFLSNIYETSADLYVVSGDGEIVFSNNLDNDFIENAFDEYYMNLNSMEDLQYVLSYQAESTLEVKDTYQRTQYINYKNLVELGNWHIVSKTNVDILMNDIEKVQYIVMVLVIIVSGGFIINTYNVNKIKRDNLTYIERLAFEDGITGLLNSNGFEKDAERILKKNNQNKYALAVFDLDSFKLINEIYGYAKGDELLEEIAQELKAYFHSSTLFGRLSNDVYILMIDCSIYSELERIPTSIRRIVGQASEKIIEYPIDISMGIYRFDDQKIKIKRAMDHADMARSYVKSEESLRHYFFDDMLFKTKMDLKLIEQEIKSAIAEKQFQVYYQPKVDPYTEKFVGAEALVRWIHPTRGFISPALFIPISEKSGDITLIGRHVFTEVCSMLKEQQKSGRNSIPVSVNLSRVELYQADIIQFLETTIKQYEIDPELIEIEITETTALNDIEIINEKIKAIHDLGISVSMDDFGTGNSTFSNLKHVDIDVLKIDRSFLCDIEENNKSREIVHGIIALAKRIGLSVVCEGVEDQKQVAILKEMNCDLIQGYVYARPMPRQEFEASF